jgi:hypothetical protein
MPVWQAAQVKTARHHIAQQINKENSMQAVAPFVAMILLLAAIIYVARWNANRVKSSR